MAPSADRDWEQPDHADHVPDYGTYRDVAWHSKVRRVDNDSLDDSAEPSSLRVAETDMAPEDAALGPDASQWIDRDKLEEIETQEMVAAGITYNSHIKGDARCNFSIESGTYLNTGTNDDRNESSGSSPPMSSSVHRNFRPKTRIPVSRNSPIPVPSAVVERESPLSQQSRRPSNAVNGEDRRPMNLSATHAPESPDHNDEPDSPVSPISDVQYRSRPSSAHYQRHSVSPSPSTRINKRNSINASLVNRSVSTPRKLSDAIHPSPRVVKRAPGPINRPEGEPPWLATMYKPDPHLPPDEQMLPTHAKRLEEDRARQLAEQQLLQQHQQQRVPLTGSHSRNNSGPSAKDMALFPSLGRQQQDGASSLWPTAYIADPHHPGDQDRKSSVASSGSRGGGYRITPLPSVTGADHTLRSASPVPGSSPLAQMQMQTHIQGSGSGRGMGSGDRLTVEDPRGRKVLRKTSNRSIRTIEVEQRVESPGLLSPVGITTTITGNASHDDNTNSNEKYGKGQDGDGRGRDKKCGCCTVM